MQELRELVGPTPGTNGRKALAALNQIDGFDAESRDAASIKDKEGLSYKEWAVRLQRYYETVEMLFWPDLFVVGGGVSKNHDKFMPLLKLRTPMVPAALRNRAGIIGAAWLAQDRVNNS